MDDRDEKFVSLHEKLAILTVAVYGFAGARDELSNVVSQLEVMRQHGDPIDNLELVQIEERIKSSIEGLCRFMDVNIDFYAALNDFLESHIHQNDD